jgi:hypothetical protein
MNKWLTLAVLVFQGFSGVSQGIVLNELSPSVTSSQVDNYGEFEDWIEIYNSSGLDVDLAGWYLSDNPEKPLKWRIPATNPKITTVLAGSYLLLWADKDTLQGPDHLGFSLNKEGEYLLLYRPGKDGPVLVDSVKYGAIPSDHSYGRCPDRTTEWTEFKHPTPCKPNVCIEVKKRKAKMMPLPVPPGIPEKELIFLQQSYNESVILTINEISCNN